MSAKTKIVVLRMKELIYTGIFAALGILFIILLLILFLPEKETANPQPPASESESPSAPDETALTSSASLYIPGIYTTELVLGGHAVNVEVIVDHSEITSIRLVNPNEAVTTMYPLLQPTLESLCEQVYEKQTLEGITYDPDTKYTSLVLLQAIQNSLNKALAENQPLLDAGSEIQP